jgi:hypothetical protein
MSGTSTGIIVPVIPIRPLSFNAKLGNRTPLADMVPDGSEGNRFAWTPVVPERDIGPVPEGNMSVGAVELVISNEPLNPIGTNEIASTPVTPDDPLSLNTRVGEITPVTDTVPVSDKFPVDVTPVIEMAADRDGANVTAMTPVTPDDSLISGPKAVASIPVALTEPVRFGVSDARSAPAAEIVPVSVGCANVWTPVVAVIETVPVPENARVGASKPWTPIDPVRDGTDNLIASTPVTPDDPVSPKARVGAIAPVTLIEPVRFGASDSRRAPVTEIEPVSVGCADTCAPGVPVIAIAPVPEESASDGTITP